MSAPGTGLLRASDPRVVGAGALTVASVLALVDRDVWQRLRSTRSPGAVDVEVVA